MVENFSAGVMRKYDLHWDEARKLNDRLIYCAVSAYGRTGPHADRAGFDPITQAESGFMSLNGHPEMPAVRTAVPMIDVTSGMSAAHAVLGALYARERSRDFQAQATFADHQAGFTDARLFIDDRNQLRPHTDEGMARVLEYLKSLSR